VLNCPRCGEQFAYGWPNLNDLIWFLLSKGVWKCSNCGFFVVSKHRIIELDDAEMMSELKRFQEIACI
jgi:ribosomal protein L37E